MKIKCPECDGEGEVAVCSECGSLASFYMIGDDLEANCSECDEKYGFEIRKYDIVKETCFACDGTRRLEVSDDFAESLEDMEKSSVREETNRGKRTITESNNTKKLPNQDILVLVIVVLVAFIVALLFAKDNGYSGPLIFFGIVGLGLWWMNKFF
ncbi:MAG: hypothetical protein ABIT08_06625 [Bacteroidia bacterium]